jgi:hypothetical protein
MSKRDGHQQGPQDHAEGAHGSKTHQAFLQQLHSRANAPITDEHAEPESKTEKHGSQRRLAQDRQQHDEAEKNSEKTRLAREMDRENVENDPDDPMSRGTS